MFYNMRNPPGCFRLPVKACRPQSQIGSIDRFTTVQGFVANHEQGRVNRIKFSKEQRAVFHSRFPPITSPQAGIFSRNIFREIYCGALDKRKKGFPKNAVPFRPKTRDRLRVRLRAFSTFTCRSRPFLQLRFDVSMMASARVRPFSGYSTSTVTTPRIFVSRRCNRRPSGPSVCQ